MPRRLHAPRPLMKMAPTPFLRSGPPATASASSSVIGARPDQSSYNLDGGNNEALMRNTNNPCPFPVALQEFSVQTNSFDARYGTNAGAVVNVVTKSGTNQWHGDAFEFIRNK